MAFDSEHSDRPMEKHWAEMTRMVDGALTYYKPAKGGPDGTEPWRPSPRAAGLVLCLDSSQAMHYVGTRQPREGPMITSASDIPWDGYWKTAGQVFTYPLATVFAATKAEADEIAGPEIRVETYDQRAFVHLALDSAEAQSRLGMWGDVAAQDAMMRGDSPTSTN